MADLAYTDTAEPRRPSLRVALSRDGFRALAFVGIAALVVGFAAAGGGYFETSWGWSALLLLWGAALALVLGRAPSLTRAQAVAFVALAGLLIWILASSAWTPSAGEPVREAERLLVYVSAALAFPLIVRRRGAAALLGGLLAGITAVAIYALATRLFPDRLGTFDAIAGYRLSEPLGYWNALAIFAALGVLLALGLAARAPGLAVRALAAASLVPLCLAVYFTFSRGGWLALAIGLAAALAFDRRRVSLATLAVPLLAWPAITIWIASSRKALTTADAPLALAVDQGAEVALAAAACAAGAAMTAVALGLAEARLPIPRGVARAYAGALAAVTVGVLLTVFVRFGAPWTIAERGWEAFSAPPPAVTDLNERLFSFSGSGRVTQWESALDAWRDAPLRGIGAGGYEGYWLEHRELPGKIRDAHSLYIEMLAEVGPFGLLLLLVALGVPVYAAFKARGHPLVPAAFGAYVAYLVHAGVDWDWEMPAVTLTALFIGASIVVAARKPEDEEKLMSPRLRYGLLTGTLALAAVAFVGLVGNMALAESAEAARAGDWQQSESKARRAATWAPWSPEPWQRIGQAQLAEGELAAARASFRQAIAKDERDWNLWLDLARASEGKAQLAALERATKLNPLSPEIAQLRQELAELGTIEVGG